MVPINSSNGSFAVNAYVPGSYFAGCYDSYTTDDTNSRTYLPIDVAIQPSSVAGTFHTRREVNGVDGTVCVVVFFVDVFYLGGNVTVT